MVTVEMAMTMAIYRHVPVMWSGGGLSLAMIACNSFVFAKVAILNNMIILMNMMRLTLSRKMVHIVGFKIF